MKKKTKIINFVLLIILLISPFKVNAATGKYAISSNNTVEIGDTISVKFTISASKLFYWQSYISYDTSRLQLISGATNFQGESDSLNGQSNVTRTLKFKAKKIGNAVVSIAMGNRENNINSDSQEVSFSKVSKTITVKEKTIVTYSSNNFLKSLKVDKYNLSPSFNKNKLEYNLDLPANTNEITISAEKEDKKAKVSGTGKVKVSEGLNKLTVKVTAENGNTKNYVINATVKELDPIEVTINQNKYTVIRKKDQFPKINSTYQQTTVKINDQDVPALSSEITKYVLVALKDSDGNINLYIYENNSYKIYQEITFNKLTVVPTEDKNIPIPNNFKEEKKTINEKEVTVYSKENMYPIFIGLNIETGEKSLYSYDEKENTIQRYSQNNPEERSNTVLGIQNNISNISNDNIDTYIIIALGIILVATYTVILINLIKKKGRKK